MLVDLGRHGRQLFDLLLKTVIGYLAVVLAFRANVFLLLLQLDDAFGWLHLHWEQGLLPHHCHLRLVVDIDEALFALLLHPLQIVSSWSLERDAFFVELGFVEWR